ncbi:MAG: hypothetical protein ACK5NY_02020 [Burkholderiaceae bacterium]|jgi:hypothetical protein
MQPVILKAVAEDKGSSPNTNVAHKTHVRHIKRITSIDDAITTVAELVHQRRAGQAKLSFALLLDYIDALEQSARIDQYAMATPLDIIDIGTLTLPVCPGNKDLN